MESNGGGVYKKALLRNFVFRKFLKDMVLFMHLHFHFTPTPKERKEYVQ